MTTTISKRIDTAMMHLANNDFENALIQISIAIDRTAKKKWANKGVGIRIKNFINEYETFIYQFISFGQIQLSKGGKISIQMTLDELLYKAIRCSLLHGDDIEDFINIVDTNDKIGVKNGKLIITPAYITGFMFSVIVDAKNKNEYCKSDPIFGIYGKAPIKINNLWGNLVAVQKYTGYTFKKI